MRALVVGLGSPDRGDDAVGPEVAARVGALGLPGVDVIVHEDPTALVDLMPGIDQLVVVDAMRSGRPPGTVAVLETGAGRPPLDARVGSSAAGTHGIGLAAAIELARALERLPGRIVVVAVEASGFDHGAEMSSRVAAAVPDAVMAAVAALAGGQEDTRSKAGRHPAG